MIKDKNINIHKPVMADEVVKFLNLKPNALLNNQVRIIDATLGTGGHSLRLLDLGVEVLGIDDDPNMINLAKEKLSSNPKMIFVNGNFRKIDEIAAQYNFSPVDGILIDLGINSMHYEAERGFSHQRLGDSLDMRLNPNLQKIKASDLLNSLNREQLNQIFGSVFDHKLTTTISKRVFEERKVNKINTVSDFIKILEKCGIKNIGLKSKAMMALRIVVNSELDNLEQCLPKAVSLLRKNGRLVVISFHSGEDAIVKNFFNQLARQGRVRSLSKKPIVPAQAEIGENPRSRSAKMRVIEKI